MLFAGLLSGILLLVFPNKQNLNSVSTIVNSFIADEEIFFNDLVDNKKEYFNSYDSLRSILVPDKQLQLFIYEKDSLSLYTTNQVLLDLPPSLYENKIQLVLLQNGWYLLQKREIKEKQIIGLSLVKSQYKIANKLLKDQNSPLEDIEFNMNISDKPTNGGLDLVTNNGEVIGSLYNDIGASALSFSYVRMLSAFIFIAIVIYFFHWFSTIIFAKIGGVLSILFFATFLLSFRFFMLVLQFPEFPTHWSLFDPNILATSYFASSLGQLLISLVFYFVWFAFLFLNSKEIKPQVQQYLYGVLVGLNTFLIFLFFKIFIIDSMISLQLYDVLTLSLFSLIAIATITFVVFLNFLSLYRFSKFIPLASRGKFMFIVPLMVYLLLAVLVFTEDILLDLVVGFLWLVVYLFISYYAAIKKVNLYQWRRAVIHIAMASLLSMFFLEHLYEDKERVQRQLLANKLIEGDGFMANYGFAKITETIKSDIVLQNYFSTNEVSYAELKNRLSLLYFADYFKNYDVDLFLFDNQHVAKTIVDTSVVSYVSNKALESRSLNVDTLIILQDSVFSNAYLGVVQIDKQSTDLRFLCVIFKPLMYSSESVYPELIKLGVGDNNTGLKDYSYAVYQDQKLVYQSGSFPYPYFVNQIDKGVDSRFYQTREWEHFQADGKFSKSVIVSSPQEGVFEPLASFSYYFVIYSLSLLLLAIVLPFLGKQFKTRGYEDTFQLTFKNKLQIALLSLVAISFVIIGLITVSFIHDQYDTYYTDRFSKKVKSIIRGTQFVLNSSLEKNNLASESLKMELLKLSEINGLDINVFDKSGSLIHTTRKELYDNGIISRKLNPEALNELQKSTVNQFEKSEKIGALSFSSFYTNLRGNNKQIIGYLNIPYFEKTNDINKEVSSFLVTLMNVYVFLFLCAVLFSIIVSNSITRPLRFISEKFKRVNLEKSNEPIEWNSNDEIGRLILEYNKMIVALEGSAKELAKTERETAWRQMARQIAHEIKNPLTPMKLSIQYLQRAIDENNPNVSELAKKVNRTLIEQIDNLSSIATAFSSFAQMPKPNNEFVELNTLLSDIVSLFETESKRGIRLQSYTEDATVFADRNQLISVFNNLLKNAIQSLDEIENGEIEVLILEEYGQIKVVVIDNGKGIPRHQFDKVFVPNFTTKSSGTGLGLAISKQIIESSGGKIWFESEIGVGTRFYVTLPYRVEGV